MHLYGLNDFFFVGQLGDANATAALSAVFGLAIINHALLLAPGIGATTLMAQQTGRGDHAAVADTWRQSIVGAAVFGTALAGVLWLGLDLLIGLANVTPEVHQHARAYLGWLLVANPLVAVLRVVEGTYRARGNGVVPLQLGVIAVIINGILTALLVPGWWGLPSLGTAGAAIATALSWVVPVAWGWWRVSQGELGFDASPSRWRHRDRPRLRMILTIGIFGSLSSVLYGLVFLILNRLAGEIGPAAQGGLGIGLRGLEWIAFAISEGFLVACVTHMGQNLGAGKIKRALRGMWWMAGISALIVQTISLSFWFFPEALVSLVSPDEETNAFAVLYLRILFFGMWAVGFEMVLYGAHIGAGLTRQAMVLGLITNGLRIPIASWVLFGEDWLQGTAWAFFLPVEVPPVVGGFSGIALAICVTAMLKAGVYAVALWSRDWEKLVRRIEEDARK